MRHDIIIAMKGKIKQNAGLRLTLPGWLAEIVAEKELVFTAPEERMRWVIGLSRQNVENKSGGPFAAAIFENPGGRLLAAGVNRVEPLNCAPAHAEIIAIALAQRHRQTWDLGNDSGLERELVASSQPCLMCLGAILWSGVTRLTYGASAADVSGILGFDEGPLPANWQKELQARGISVIPEFLRTEAKTVLALYKTKQGTIYNSRRKPATGIV